MPPQHLMWEPFFMEHRRVSFRGLKTCFQEEAKAQMSWTSAGCSGCLGQDHMGGLGHGR